MKKEVEPEVAEPCEMCDGTGKEIFSCCGVDMRGRDHDICSARGCGEHTGWPGSLKEAEDCHECKGTGKQ